YPWQHQLSARRHDALDRSCGFVTVAEHRPGPLTDTPNLWMNGEKGGRLQTVAFISSRRRCSTAATMLATRDFAYRRDLLRHLRENGPAIERTESQRPRRSRAHSTFRLSLRTSVPHLVSSLSMSLAYVSGVEVRGSPPSARMRCLTSGVSTSARSAALRRSTIGRGVPAGASTP